MARNDMMVNGTKTYTLHTGKLLAEDNYLSPEGHRIEFKETMKDLGLRISNKGDFGPHITAVRQACLKKCHWISRTFRNCSALFLKFMYSTYIQSTLDYGSQIWAPTKLGEINILEKILKVWTKNCTTIKHFHFWE